MASLAPHDTLHEIEHFYYREARLFGQKRFREWLEQMVAPEIHYYLPIVEDRLKADRRPPPEFPPAIFDDDYKDLDERIARLETNLVWSEDPPSQIRHLITNIEAYSTDEPGHFEAYSNFLVYRRRRERDEATFVGEREDLLRRQNGEFKLVRRKLFLAQRVITHTNLYLFF
jgi:3-phenylpropionate/cinnamic acid dioxygenase small subunit